METKFLSVAMGTKFRSEIYKFEFQCLAYEFKVPNSLCPVYVLGLGLGNPGLRHESRGLGGAVFIIVSWGRLLLGGGD